MCALCECPSRGHLAGKLLTYLTGGQTPWFTEHLRKERGVLTNVLGHHVEAEQVSVDASASHGITVQILVSIRSHFQQTDQLLFLKD